MEAAYKELEDLRLEMGTLREEYRVKAELSERLRRAHHEQSTLLQEAKAEIEKQSMEICAKDEEISLSKRMFEELRLSLSQKELALKQLGIVHDNLRSSTREQQMHLEAKNRELAVFLDEANAEKEEQGRIISSCKEEIGGLKNRLLVSEKRCQDAEIRARAPKELRRRDEVLLKLEEEKTELENQLKWKIEQFRHLEEAHNKLQRGFREAKREWGTDKSNMADEIHKLQMDLDSQIRVGEELRSQLTMCNQALAHEESRRRLLEAQFSESRQMYDKIVSEYEDARLTIERMTEKRDEEIASLRSSLSSKAANLKESEFRRTRLEQENKELQICLKESQEAHMNNIDSAASIKTLRQKLKSLEQTHRSCSEKLKATETELIKKMEKVKNDLDECHFQLSLKDNELTKLQLQLDGTHSLLLQQRQENEEISTLFLVVKSKISEIWLELQSFRPDMEKDSTDMSERIALLTKQLEEKNVALVRSQTDANQILEVVNSLQKRIEYVETIESNYFELQKELEKYKEMIEESSKSHCLFKQQACQKESALQDDLARISDALEQANFSLEEKTNEMRKMDFELQQKGIALEKVEKLKNNLEREMENYSCEIKGITEELEIAYIANANAEERISKVRESFCIIIEEKDKTIEDLKQQNVILKEDNARQKLELAPLKTELQRSSEELNKKFLSNIEEMNCRLNQNETALYSLEQNFISRQSQLIVEFDKERRKILEVLEDKDNIIAEIRDHVVLLKQDFNHSVESAVASKLTESKHEAIKLHKMLDNVVAVYICGEHEIEFRNILIFELEDEIASLQLQLCSEERLSFGLKKLVGQLKIDLSNQRLEYERKHVQALSELECLASIKAGLEDQVSELQAKLKSLDGVIAKYSVERETLLGEMMSFSDSVTMIFHKDEQLIRNWETLSLKATDDDAIVGTERKDHLNSYVADMKNCISCSSQKACPFAAKRLPLRENNF